MSYAELLPCLVLRGRPRRGTRRRCPLVVNTRELEGNRCLHLAGPFVAASKAKLHEIGRNELAEVADERVENAVGGDSGVVAEPKLRQNGAARGKTRLRAPDSDDSAGPTKGF